MAASLQSIGYFPRRIIYIGLASVFFLFAGCSTVRYASARSGNPGTAPLKNADIRPGMVFTGIASFYGDEFDGRETSNGETYDKNEMTAAHPSLPFHTIVKVTSVKTGKSVTVRINDRGPFVPGRIIDLSRAAAEQIGLTKSGLAEVTVEVMAGSGKTPAYAPD